MSKHTALISLVLGLVLAGFRFHLFSEPPAYSRFSLDPAELARQANSLEDHVRTRTYFISIKDGILESLARGELSLPQACDQLYQSALEIYPRYLRFLGAAVNLPLKEKLARNLVAYFRSEAEFTPSFMEVALRLEQDLAAKPFRNWCRHPWAEESGDSRISADPPPARAAMPAGGPA